MLVALAILPMAEPAQASFWDDLWLTKDQQAKRQLESGEAASAAELFEDPEWRAVANYHASAFEDSARGFGESDELRNLYNLGNALARQGNIESAISAYEEVLEIDPAHADAAYNRDLLKQAQEQQQQQESEQQQSSDSQGEGQESDQSSESQEQNSENQSESDGESQDSEGQQSDQEASQEDLEALQEELQRAAEEARKQQQEMLAQMSEEELEQLRRDQEQEQAMEQWLRRIPNDPGGLLRRKFRYQYQKSGKDQDGNNTWPDDEVQPW